MSAAALHISNLRFEHAPAPGEDPARAFSLRVDHLTLAPGEQLLLSAPSGTGKSTLLALIAGLLDPADGAVEVAGQRVHALRGAARDRFRGRHVGLVFQTLQLLEGFAADENVMAAMLMASLPSDRAKARALLDRLGMSKHASLVENLSVGQRQRVAVARAVACSPTLVLADEPTASLDPANARDAVALLQSACREGNAALLCVSHDETLAGAFPRRVTLDELALPAQALAQSVAQSFAQSPALARANPGARA
jgi:putative ABC transport system ATP-binding protein